MRGSGAIGRSERKWEWYEVCDQIPPWVGIFFMARFSIVLFLLILSGVSAAWRSPGFQDTGGEEYVAVSKNLLTIEDQEESLIHGERPRMRDLAFAAY